MSGAAHSSIAADAAEILVVEDDADALRWMSTLLSEAGYAVRPASDGALALRSAKARPPALVLLDIKLPGIDGFEVCRQLKADANNAAVPVIFLSGLHEDHEKGNAFRAGGVDYITKPIRKEELLARVETHLTIVRTRRQLVAARDEAQRSAKAERLAVRSLRATLYGIGDAVIATDAEGRVELMNPVAESLTGWPEAEARGKPLTDIFRILNENSRAAVESPVALVLREGKIVGMANHTLLVARDGSERPISDSGAPVRDDEGNLTGVVLVFRDQTAERAAEHALREKSAAYENLAENLPDLLARFDSDLRHMYVNQAAAGAGTLTPEQYIGKTIAEVGVPEPLAEVWHAKLRRVFTTGERAEIASVFPTPRGPRHFLTTLVAERGEGGDVQSVLSIARDITDIKLSDLAAQTERDHLSAVLVAAPAAIFVVDATGQAEHVNPAAHRLFGSPEAGAERRTGNVIGCVHRADDPRGCSFGPSCGSCPLWGAVREGLAGRAVRDREIVLEVEHGGAAVRRMVIANAEPLIIDGKPLTVVALQDMTDLRREQHEREALQAGLIQSDRLASMGMIAAGVAHEINNPLAFVLYNLESITDDLTKLAAAVQHCRTTLGAEHSEAALAAMTEIEAALFEPTALDDAISRAAEALAGAQRIKKIAKGLGTFSRVEQVELSRVNLNSAIESATTMAFNEVKYRAVLVKDLAELPAVWGSEGKLGQVFLNLVVNAAQSIPEGNVDGNRVTVRTWVAGNDVYAEVADTGAGIPSESLQRVFEPFFTSKGVGKGSGLGLAICRNLVTEFGGDIRIESEVGKGTRVIVRLPAAPAAPSHVSAATASDRPTERAVRGRVLVVDDEPGIRSTMKRLLGRAHEIVTAASGAEAQSILARDRSFDVILCDLMMPEMTGMDLHEWLSRHDATLASRMIFVTGGAYTPHASEYLARTGNLRIEKPFDSATLTALVAGKVLELSRRAAVPPSETGARRATQRLS